MRSTLRLCWHWSALLLYAVVGLIGYVLSSTSATPASTDSALTGPRLTYTVPRRDLRMSIREMGTVESSENTEIICQVPGRNMVTWVVESGSQVKKGDVLVRLDTLYMEEQINERSKYAHWSRAGAESSKFQVRRLKLAIPEFDEGRSVVEMENQKTAVALAQMDLGTSQSFLNYYEEIAARGYISQQIVDNAAFRVTQGQMMVDRLQRELKDLKDYTHRQALAKLKGDLTIAQAEFEASDERAGADESRRDRALQELEYCVIKAPRDGLVIYPSAAKWRTRPDISIGGDVHKDQVLLLMPNLKKMQVKIGIHETQIEQIKVGLKAIVALGSDTITAEVASVATVPRPGGSWSGNIVKYDTMINLPSDVELKPGMSAEVEVVISEHQEVLTIPVAAVMESDQGPCCWVQQPTGPERRTLTLGATNDALIIVTSGLDINEKIFLHPAPFVENDNQGKGADGEPSPDTPQQDTTPAKAQPPTPS